MRRLSSIIPLGLLSLLAALSCAAETVVLEPTNDQRATCKQVTMALENVHYGDLSVDDAFSEQLLERYLEHLDPSRVYFVQSDIEAFMGLDKLLDDAIKDGNLRPAFAIFNRYQDRRNEVMRDTLAWVKAGVAGLSFDSDESMETDREDAPWPQDEAERTALWQERFKNDVLSLRLAEKNDEEIVDLLTRRYEDRLRRSEQINGRDVFRVFMNAVTSCFGPHTEYFPAHESENFDIQLSLTVHGIGALLGTEGEYCAVSRVIPGGPADKDGRLKSGDRIVAVGQGPDGEMVDVVAWRNDDIVDLIRGEKGTVVRLGILGPESNDLSSTSTLALTRDEVKLEEQAAQKRIETEVRDGRAWRMGIIALPAFYMDFEAARNGDPNYKSATRDVARLIEELKEEEVDGIILDLRGNGGGSLNEAQDLTALFLGEGPVVQVRDTQGQTDVLLSGRKTPLYDGPLCVVVDRIAASASEIFAGAIQDTGRGVVVGTRTFGKGTVQRLIKMGDGQLKITLAKFYRISGGSTQHKGVAPDVEFTSLYPEDEVGESALPNPLPWDSIGAVPHPFDGTVQERRQELQRRHDAREATDPDLIYVDEQIAYAAAIGDQTRLSLNEAQRRVERKKVEAGLLAIENRRRVSTGLDPVEKMDDVDDNPLRAKDRPHPFVKEAIQVLIDFVTLDRTR